MNIKNNKRRQATRERIESFFIELLQTKDITKISVSEICKGADVNRSTFYANYLDIYDLADKIRDRLEQEVFWIYGSEYKTYGDGYLKLFCHIKENQVFYRAYFKLGYDDQHAVNLDLLSKEHQNFPKEHLEYHLTFHKAGLNAILKKWLASGCKESPEEMARIIRDEYKRRN